jgi:hypothetical protein
MEYMVSFHCSKDDTFDGSCHIDFVVFVVVVGTAVVMDGRGCITGGMVRINMVLVIDVAGRCFEKGPLFGGRRMCIPFPMTSDIP